MNNNITVIVRSSGERTVRYCRYLLEQQIPKQNICVIEETPFSAALKKGFEIGIEKGMKWTLCIDADVLVNHDIMNQLIKHAEKSDESIFEIQGLVLDKFIPIKRPAGNHLYRTSLIDKAIQFIPKEGTSLRPESDMLKKMRDIGYPWKQIGLIIGIHDFKQYNADIYRKCFLQAHKHSQYISLLESYWDNEKTDDKDFQVALWGVRAGKIYNGDIYVDKNFHAQEIKDILVIMNCKEKKQIQRNQFNKSYVDNIINQHDIKNDWINNLQQKMFPHSIWNKIHNVKPALHKNYIHLILLHFILFYTGSVFEKFGSAFKRISKYINKPNR